ncbi:hypothetical protein [Fluviicola chungangensis]|uniref:KTSC domain-containing protein n=1 Tax=Fluviicola chungangensis TaxID=2597671 RepID=A0A556MP22_9FLAO|nr:hypothetical protein [Fluviicola chungangensis]TSJ41660.1 hypothetical protein FO442_14475 [Fluviicola chungangensis]
MVQRYLNRGGNSNVANYSIEGDSITVQFKDGSMYLYNYFSTGVAGVEQMKRLAVNGMGLNSYISRFVRKQYARKLR